jgi:two-component system, NarL family, sensor kinase
MFYYLFLPLLEISELEGMVLSGIVILVLVCVFIIAFLTTSYKRKIKYQQQLLQLDFERQQAVLQAQLEIQEQTLKTISQEIHDNVGQILSLVKLNLHTFKDTAEPQLETTKSLVSKAISDLRDLSRSLQGGRVLQLGLQQAIEDELLIIRNTGQLQTQLSVTGKAVALPPQKEIVLFRMVQEAINNVVKHANATNLYVSIAYQPAQFLITVQDDGSGFQEDELSPASTGLGLSGLRSRAKLIDAALKIHSTKNQGTTVSITSQLA